MFVLWKWLVLVPMSKSPLLQPIGF